jgi:hypothetical protein
MKNLALFISALFMISCLFSCKKTDGGMLTTTKTSTGGSVNNQTKFSGVVPIEGKWNVKTDSVFSSVGASGTGKTYTGETGDYFNFGTNNKLYIKEGANLDTFTYKMLTDSTLSLIPAGAPINVIPFAGFIQPTTATSVIVTWTPSLGNPGSFYSRTVSLAK